MNKKETYQNILHLFFSGYLDLLPEKLKKKTLLHGSNNWLTYSFRYIFVYKKLVLFSFLKSTLPFQNRTKLTGKIWAFADTENQFQSLQFLNEKTPDITWVSRKFLNTKVSFIHLIGGSRLFKLVQFPSISKQLSRKNNSYKGKIFEASGQFDFHRELLQKYQPKLIIFSNDHSIAPRSLILAAKSLKISTVYIQHASVSLFFPNLEASLNLLEGQHAFDIYKKCGPINGMVKLIGMPKFEQYKHLQNNKPSITNIGIALNPSDNQEIIETFINEITPQFPNIIFTYRKHPREERIFTFNQYKNLKESISEQEDVFTFLTKQDMLFAGDSSIHLEATLLNIISIYFDFTAILEKQDYYGFIKNGMIDTAKTIESAIKIISKSQDSKTNVTHRASYYNHLINSKENKSSTTLAIEYINSII